MIELVQRKPWDAVGHIVLIGPGGAGKSSLGAALGPLIERRTVDLDAEFKRQIGDIDTVIRSEGYKAYKVRNAALAATILREAKDPILFVSSSGFLTPDNPPSALRSNQAVLETCFSIRLLPSADQAKAIDVVVSRQLARTFSRGREREEAIIRARYPVYAPLGDLAVSSTAPVADIARAIARRLKMTKPAKVCAVPWRVSNGVLEVLCFVHPLAGRQFVKGTWERGETPLDGAKRELREESGLSDPLKTTFLGQTLIGDPPVTWLFYAFEGTSLSDQWDHWTKDGGGQVFSFFWHPIDASLDREWHPIFHQAMDLVRSSLPGVIAQKIANADHEPG